MNVSEQVLRDRVHNMVEEVSEELDCSLRDARTFVTRFLAQKRDGTPRPAEKSVQGGV